MKRLLFIFNPHTGGGRLSGHLLEILCLMGEAGYDVATHPTRSRGDAYRTAMARGMEFELVVCCGGDGTLNEVVHGLMELDSPPELGYIPGGTTNDFAASLGLPRDNMVAAADRALHPRRVFSCDIGTVNGQQVFTYVAAFGAFTDVSYSTPQKFKNLVGYLAYILEGVQRLPNLQSCEVTVRTDEEDFTDEILLGMVSNSTSVGGFSFSREVALDDGLFEVLLVRRPQSLGDVAALSAALLTRNTDSPYIISKHVREISIATPEPIPWTLDGEFGGEIGEAYIRVHQKALRVHI